MIPMPDRARRRLIKTFPKRATRAGTLAFGATFLLAALLAVSALLSFDASKRRYEAERWEVHTLQVLQATASLRLGALSTLRGERGYLLTHDESFLAPYTIGRARLSDDVTTLRALVRDNLAQEGQLARIEGTIDHHLGIMARMIELEREGNHAEAIARIRAGEGRRAIEGILAEVDRFEAVERGYLATRTAAAFEASAKDSLFRYVLLIVGLGLLTVATAAAIALRRSLAREAKIREQLRRIAMTDELTGLANRRELLSGLDRMIGSAKRYGRPLTVALLDIDRFKRVNDTYGHPAGDEVIRRVAEAARELMREQDLVGRLGGEEFVIVFPDTNSAKAVAACERLREHIRDMVVEIDDGTVFSITLSSGVAQFTRADDRHSIVARADQALYEAKEGGRDQVRLAA